MTSILPPCLFQFHNPRFLRSFLAFQKYNTERQLTAGLDRPWPAADEFYTAQKYPWLKMSGSTHPKEGPFFQHPPKQFPGILRTLNIRVKVAVRLNRAILYSK